MTPTTGGLGDPCANPTDCDSGKCASPASGQPSVCTQACDVTAQDCPATFQCIDTGNGGQCFVKPAAPASSTTTTTTSGCSVGSSANPTKPVPWKQAGIAGLVVLAALARRRRRSSPEI